MLKNSFDPDQPYRFVRYGRMSSDRQNPRSPEQQFDTIERERKRQNLPWVFVKDYRNDGISGRYFKQRAGLQEMLNDIKGGLLVDLILVDTAERLGRAEEIQELRRVLAIQYGVLVLTADSHFADPTSVSGKALTMVENLRSTEDGRIKAHNVLRGKRDAARQGKWPGGNPPFGYRLESILKHVNGRQEVDYSRLVPDPVKAPIIQLLYAKAAESGWGSSRLAQYLNAHPDVPQACKPMKGSSVGFFLKQPIYVGTLVWERVSTGVVDDRRVYEHNAAEEQLVIREFCEPLVPREQWERVQQLREQRAVPMIAKRRAQQDSAKLIKPPARGLVLKYPLTGQVRCGECGRAMTPASSKAFTAKSGEVRRYVGYVCPAASAGTCSNHTRVPETWLRTTVVEKLLACLSLAGGPELNTAGFREITALVERELERKQQQRPRQRPRLEAEAAELTGQLAGWMQSLGKRDLSDALRRDLESRYEEAHRRQQEIARLLDEEDALDRDRTLQVDEETVLAKLEQLPELIGGDNTTLANFQLALHIDTIRCYADGRVVMRTCKLGILPDVHALVQRVGTDDSDDATRLAHCRRRGHLTLDIDTGLLSNERALVHFALNPERFVGLPDDFFWVDELQIPRRKSWSKMHAPEVQERRMAGLTFEQLAKEFKKSIPTLRKALRYARDA